MSAQPPGQPQVSADGKFYWDGQRWVPMSRQRWCLFVQLHIEAGASGSAV